MRSTKEASGENVGSRDALALIILVGVLAAAFFLRVLYLAYQDGMAVPVRHPDTYLYDMIARHLLAGDGYVGENYLIVRKGEPTAFYGPVYPLFLAFIYGVFGYSFKFVQIAQIIISVATAFLVFETCRFLYGKKAGLLAAALFAVYPELVAYPSAVLSETLFIFLEVLFVYVFARALSRDDPGAAVFALAGGILAVAFLCRQVIALAPVAALPFAALRYRNRGFSWIAKRVFAFAAVAIVIIAPWSIRNYYALGTISPGTTTGGVTFWWGNNTDRRGMDLPTALNEVKRKHPGLSEIEMNSLLYKLGAAEIAQKGPIGMARLFLSKWGKIWMPYLFYEGKWRSIGVAQYAVIYALLAAGLYGSIAMIKRASGTLAVTAVLISGIAVHLMTIGNSRYSLPFMPLLMITSAPVFISVYRRGEALFSRKRPA